jgi:hypothetical protein
MQDNTSSKHIADMRCPHCDSQDIGLGEETRFGGIRWYCGGCGQSGDDAEGDVFIYIEVKSVASRRVA